MVGGGGAVAIVLSAMRSVGRSVNRKRSASERERERESKSGTALSLLNPPPPSSSSSSRLHVHFLFTPPSPFHLLHHLRCHYSSAISRNRDYYLLRKPTHPSDPALPRLNTLHHHHCYPHHTRPQLCLLSQPSPNPLTLPAQPTPTPNSLHRTLRPTSRKWNQRISPLRRPPTLTNNALLRPRALPTLPASLRHPLRASLRIASLDRTYCLPAHNVIRFSIPEQSTYFTPSAALWSMLAVEHTASAYTNRSSEAGMSLFFTTCNFPARRLSPILIHPLVHQRRRHFSNASPAPY